MPVNGGTPSGSEQQVTLQGSPWRGRVCSQVSPKRIMVCCIIATMGALCRQCGIRMSLDL